MVEWQGNSGCFTADHGDLIGAHGLFNKGALAYDELYRIPLIIQVPGRIRKMEEEGGVMNMDLIPTLFYTLQGLLFQRI